MTSTTDYPIHQLEYDGKLGKIYLLWLTNFFLGILTLGIYRFWGKVRMRKYLARSVLLMGDRFEYTGNGKQLLIGFLKALPILLAIFVPFQIFPAEQYPLVNLLFIPFYYLMRLGSYTALRYRLAHTTWRGIRGSLQGSAFTYANMGVAYLLLNVLTLGLTIPHTDMKMIGYKVRHMHFGSAPALFEGKAKGLMKSHLITLLLAIPTLGASRLWYKAALLRHAFSATTVHSVRLLSYHSGFGLLKQIYGGILLIIVTLGLGFPLLLHRNTRYFVKHVAIYGNLQPEAILQSQETIPTTGEGLDAALGDFIA